MNLDSFQWAFVEAVARKNGDKDVERYAERKCDEQVRREIAERRSWA